jgi:hypothetical protein
VAEQLERGGGFGAQPLACRLNVTGLEGEASGQPVADSKYRVDRPLHMNRRNRKHRPVGELVSDESGDHIDRHTQLVLVHGHVPNFRSGDLPMSLSFFGIKALGSKRLLKASSADQQLGADNERLAGL